MTTSTNYIDKSAFLERYGDVSVTFCFYYKYNFYFKGEYEGEEVTVQVGGDEDTVYYLSVVAGEVQCIKDLPITGGTVAVGGKVVMKFV